MGDAPPQPTWADRLDQLATADPQAPALTVAVHSAEQLSRGEMSRRSAGVARLFAARGVSAGSVVCVQLPNGMAFVLAVLAAWRLGATVVPLRWDLPAAERDELLMLARPAVLVAATSIGERLGVADLLAAAPMDPAALPRPQAASPAWMIASGGSTGKPKLISPGNSTAWNALPPPVATTASGGWHSTHLVCSPLYHTQGFAGLVFKLLEGARVVLMPRFDAANLLDLVERERINSFALVPTMAIRLLEQPNLAKWDLSSVKAVTLGAGAAPDSVIRGLIDLIGADKLRIGYGMSEGIATVLITGNEWLKHPGSVGKPADVETRVVDEQDQPLPAGQVGELFFRPRRGMHAFRYLGEAKPRTLPGGWASVGDIGKVDAEGYLHVLDRRTDMIKTGGANVFASEVEAALMAHPDVADAAVIGLPDAEWGRRVHAIVQLHRGCGLANVEANLRDHVRSLLAAYKAPRSFEFIGNLGRSEVGKLNRQALARARE